jgi:Na+/H+ antiporter NhaD/arsenite permease-like protein
MEIAAIVLFILTYALLLILPQFRPWIALASAALFVAFGIMPIGKVFFAVDWNVILMIAGSMGVVSLFIDSKMPELLADRIIDKMPDVKWAIISLSLFAGIISAFIDNVATVLMVAPVALTIARKLKTTPVPSIVAIAVASNLQGAATLVGDTTSILLGGYAKMDFLDFFFFKGKIGMFWVVQAGAIAATLILLVVFRKYKDRITPVKDAVVEDFFPSFLLSGMVLFLILASFIPNKISITNGLICTSLFAVGLIRQHFVTNDASLIMKALKDIDYFTILLLAGLFVVIGGITEAGVVAEISKIFVSFSGENLFLIFTLIVWASVFFSAFIDNIPYVATMLPVVGGIASLLNVDPNILYFGLLSGATLGGNLTPIGASANIAALGILRKEGHQVSTIEFMKIGIPFTLAAVVTGYLLIWFIWS